MTGFSEEETQLVAALNRRAADFTTRPDLDAAIDMASNLSGATANSKRRSRVRAAVVAAAASLVLVGALFWMVGDGEPAEVVAGEGEASASLEGDCSTESVAEILRSGTPTFDYQPAGSYSALASSSEAVVSGRLVSAARVTTSGRSFIELTVADATNPRGEPRADVSVIAYDATWVDSALPDPLATLVSLEGVNFIGFLKPWSGVRGGWTPGPEGLYIACGTAEPVLAVFNDAAGPRDEAPTTLLKLQAIVGAQLIQAEREAEAVAAEEARMAAQRAAALEEARVDAHQSTREPVLTDVTEARVLWNEADIGDYQFQYTAMTTMGIAALVDVLVEDGEPARVEVRRGDTEPAPTWTVDDLFDIIESADDVREIAFDSVRGYPTQITVDPDSSVVDDEISVTVTELFSTPEIENAAIHLQAWFPESVEMPIALIDLVERMNVHRTNSSTIGDTYLLHSNGDLEVYLYRNLSDLCLLTAEPALQSERNAYGSMSAGCQSDTGFSRDGDWTASSNDIGSPSYLVVVPPARYLTESWHLSITSNRDYEMEMTERSVLVTFAHRGIEEDVIATLRCECGDLTYTFQLLADE